MIPPCQPPAHARARDKKTSTHFVDRFRLISRLSMTVTAVSIKGLFGRLNTNKVKIDCAFVLVKGDETSHAAL